MKIKELIEKLKKLPQDKEVYVYENTEWSYDALEIKDATLEPVCVGYTTDCGETMETCGACEGSYCVFNDDGVYDIIEEHVILDFGYEKYEIKELEDD